MRYVLAFVLVLTTACGGDPLDEFEGIVPDIYEGILTGFVSIDPKPYAFPDDWVPSPTYSYDVQQTDSLVSPYVAEVSVEYILFLGAESGEFAWADATAGVPDDVQIIKSTVTITYAYQENRWVPAGVQIADGITGSTYGDYLLQPWSAFLPNGTR